MINKLEILISFPMGASFSDNVNEMIYRRFINFVHDISCMCIDHKCKDCPEKKYCRYYKMTGENFTKYPGIIIENDLFEKKRFKVNEQKKFTFYLIGSMIDSREFIPIFFESLKQNLSGNFFYINSVEMTELNKETKEVNSVIVTTPISSFDFIKEVNEMIDYYNSCYGTSISFLNAEAEIVNPRRVSLHEFRTKTRKFKINGYTGKVVFKTNIELDLALILMGVGKFNLIGGGQIET